MELPKSKKALLAAIDYMFINKYKKEKLLNRTVKSLQIIVEFGIARQELNDAYDLYM